MTETTEDKIRAESVYSIGTCKYCGQAVSLLPAEYSQEAANQAATRCCNCFRAEQDRQRRYKIGLVKDELRCLLCEDTPSWESKEPVMDEDELDLLGDVVQGVVDKVFGSVTVDVRGICKVKIAMTGAGMIKVRRTETRQAETEC